MKIKPIIFGSTGMLGQAVLLECIENEEVESILVINRNTGNVKHPKLKEIIHSDLNNLSGVANQIAGYTTCFFCLGISSAGMSEQEYYDITYEITLRAAKALLAANKDMTFCYVSGAGTDSSEKGKVMWARVKGKTENDLLALPFKKAYMFRPAFIQPMKGLRSKTRLYNVMYTIFKPFYFILKHFNSFVTNTDVFAKAMVLTVRYGYEKNILENSDINKIVRDYQK